MNVSTARRIAGSVALALALSLAGTAKAQCFAARMAADKPFSGDRLGSHVDISGSRAVLAAPRGGPDDPGRVIIFERTAAREWSQAAVVQFTDDNESAFQLPVAIHGTYVAIGLPFADVLGQANAGKVLVYRRVVIFGNPSWILDETINNPSPGVNDRFGWSVDLTNADGVITLAVGAPHDEHSGFVEAGRARIFSRASDGTWSLEDSVIATTPREEAHFGISLAFNEEGDRLVVGAPDESDSTFLGPGAAYVYSRTGSDWNTGTRIAPPAGADDFGVDVAISGNWIAVGDPRVDQSQHIYDVGAVFMYSRFGSSWILRDTLFALDPQISDYVGASVDMVDGRLVAGDPSHNRVLFWQLNSGEWQTGFPYVPVDPPPGSHYLGSDVALSEDGEYLLAGDLVDSGSGAAYAYTTDQNPGSTCAGGPVDGVPFLEPGTSYFGCNSSTTDGSTSCVVTNSDVWYQFTPPCSGTLALSTCGSHDLGAQDSGMDTVLSVHTGCPGFASNDIACNDDAPSGNWPDACGLFGNLGTRRDSALKVAVTAGHNYKIRVASRGTSLEGLFVLHVGFTCCRVDWDGNGVVNSTDVSNFINDWFQDQANGTTVTDYDGNGVVNSTDVSMFINDWFAGCSV
jgi:hypothetical protein